MFSDNYKIKMIGPKYLLAPLSLLGIEVHPADSETEAKKALDVSTRTNGPCLIFITERIATDLTDEIDRLNREPGINVVLIPDNQGSTGLAWSKLSKLIKNSIGAEIISRK